MFSLIVNRIPAGGGQGSQVSRVGAFSLNRLRRVLAVSGLGGPSKDGARPSGEEGSEEPDSVWSRRQSVSHSHFIPEGPTAIVVPRELVFLHETLRGGEKGDDLDISSGNSVSLGIIPPRVGDPPTAFP